MAKRSFISTLIMAVLLPTLSHAQKPNTNRESDLLEVSSPSNSPASKAIPNELKIVSYNIRWRVGDELSEIAKALKSGDALGGAAIIGLQEVDRNKDRTGHTNTARKLADELGMNYAWAAPPQAKRSKEEEPGVALLSPYPLTDVERIVLPHEGPVAEDAGRWRLQSRSVTPIARVFVLPIIGSGVREAGSVARGADDLTSIQKYPAIVLGDFNTWEVTAGDKTKKLFGNVGFNTPFTDDTPTFLTRVLITIELKLDWIWLRGLPFEKHGIDRSIKVSDHWPLWTVVKTKSPARERDRSNKSYRSYEFIATSAHHSQIPYWFFVHRWPAASATT